MGTLKQGILGGFSGKVGTVIGSSRNGIGYIRGLTTRHKDANTPAQQDQRAKFALVMQFLRPLAGLLRMGFKTAGSNRSGFNAAMAYTLQNAVTGLAPDFQIDYAKVLICRGNLAGALNAAAVCNVAGQISFTWDNNSPDFGAKATDKVVLMAYCPTLQKGVSVIGEATRLQAAQILLIPAMFSGQALQTYIGFCNAAQTEFSRGGFLAEVNAI